MNDPDKITIEDLFYMESLIKIANAMFPDLLVSPLEPTGQEDSLTSVPGDDAPIV